MLCTGGMGGSVGNKRVDAGKAGSWVALLLLMVRVSWYIQTSGKANSVLVLSDLVEHTYSDLISNGNRMKQTFGVETGKTQSKRVHTSSSPLRYCLHFSLYTGSFRIVFCTHWGGALDLFETHCFPELLLLFVALICGLAIFNSGAEGSSEWLWDSQKSLTLKVLSLGT